MNKNNITTIILVLCSLLFIFGCTKEKQFIFIPGVDGSDYSTLLIGSINASNITLWNNCADGEILKWSDGVGKCGSDSSGSDGNNYVTSISYSGTDIKTLTLSRDGLTDLTAQFNDLTNTTQQMKNAVNGTILNLANAYGYPDIDTWNTSTQIRDAVNGTNMDFNNIKLNTNFFNPNINASLHNLTTNVLLTNNISFLTPTGVYKPNTFYYSDAGGTFYISTGTYIMGNVLAGGDIYTQTAGYDLWLGASTQTSANFRAYTTGELVASNISVKNITLHQNCADGEILKWSDGVGKCGTDNSGSSLESKDVSSVYDGYNNLSKIKFFDEFFVSYDVVGTYNQQLGTGTLVNEPNMFGVANFASSTALHSDGAYSCFPNEAQATTTGRLNISEFFVNMTVRHKFTSNSVSKESVIGAVRSFTTIVLTNENNTGVQWGAFFYYNQSITGSPQNSWIAKLCASSSSCLVTNTTIVPDTNWHTFTIKRKQDSGTNYWLYYIDETLRANLTGISYEPYTNMSWIGTWTETSVNSATNDRLDYIYCEFDLPRVS